eukprot:TRINITY_DN12503_c0_g1_i1.p1 TRINITY_DN12503_c0_g1~~TRINITY_DN12503_c0_g1_i1.p1  ORF type:complete len:650 (+),score=189.93 TRINITY_DN12503_c0_g1_i1:590-2539(+)
MTHGVEIHKEIDEIKQCAISIWDFAGHEEYHGSSSIFFGNENCYLLAFDCSLEVSVIAEKNRLTYFLFLLREKLKNSKTKIYMIGTKLDNLENKLKDKVKLKSRLEEINNEIRKIKEKFNLLFEFKEFKYEGIDLLFKPINNYDTKINEVKGLRNTILEEYSETELGSRIGKNHNIVRTILEKMADDKVEIVKIESIENALKKMFGEFSIKQFDLTNVLSDLHDVGICVYFKSKSSMKNFVITNPDWLNKLFREFLDLGRLKILDLLFLLFKKTKKEKVRNNPKLEESPFLKELTDLLLLIVNIKEKNDTYLQSWFSKKLTNKNFDIFTEITVVEDKFKSFLGGKIKKLSFQYLSEKLTLLEYLLMEGGLVDLLKKLKNKWKVKEYHFLPQTIFTINNKDKNGILDRLSPFPLDFFNDEKNKFSLMLEYKEAFQKILIILNILIPKIEILEKSLEEDHSNRYLISLLFPFEKPKELILSGNLRAKDIKMEEWKMKYSLPFKPCTMWKPLFIKLRNSFILGENVFLKILDEFYWIDGFIFSFIEKHKKDMESPLPSVIVQLKIYPTKEEKYEMQIKLKSEKNIENYFNKINNSVISFLGNWSDCFFENKSHFTIEKKNVCEKQNEIEFNRLEFEDEGNNKYNESFVFCPE